MAEVCWQVAAWRTAEVCWQVAGRRSLTVLRGVSLGVIHAAVSVLQHGLHQHLEFFQQHLMPLPAHHLAICASVEPPLD